MFVWDNISLFSFTQWNLSSGYGYWIKTFVQVEQLLMRNDWTRCDNIQVLKLFVKKIPGKWYLFTPAFPGGLQDVDTPYLYVIRYNVHFCWKLLVPFGHLKQLLFLLFSQVRLIIYLNVVSQCLFLFQEEKHSLGIPSGWPGALRWRRIAWLEAEPNGGCSLEKCGTSVRWRSSIHWVCSLIC